MKKASVNYWVDVATGIAFVLSALSGLVFLLPLNPANGFLGIGYRVWNSLHTWSSLAVIGGVGVHLALHWKWIVAMTQRMLSLGSHRGAQEPVSDMACGEAQGRPISRRAFLIFGGASAVVIGAMVAGYKALFDSAEAGQSDSQPLAAQQEGDVACPFGLINDPYPGQCRHYLDANGDGICDYSVPGSAASLPSNGELGSDARHQGQRRRGWGQP